jgi:farnesyl-diphosphate farnesyltransferase
MGLFLQKTNIIRDYLEDINEEPAPRSAASCFILPL